MKKQSRKNKNPVTENYNSGKSLSLALALLVILILLTWSGAIHNNFVSWDDFDYVINNELVRNDKAPDLKAIFSTVVSLNYHPLTILSLSLNDNDCKNCQDGISPRPFIAGNIILHALNTLLVFILIYLLFRKDLIVSFIVAAVFAVHPMHVESVAWISARKDVLSSFFFLSGLISWIRYIITPDRKYPWLILSFLLFVAATLSKATTVVFPLVAVLIWYLIYQKPDPVQKGESLKDSFSHVIIPLVPFFAVSVFIGLITINVQNGENFLGMFQFSREPEDAINTAGDFSILQRTGIACYGFFVYMIKFLIPVRLSTFYPYPSPEELSDGLMPVLFIISVIAFILVVLLIFLSIKKTKIFAFCLGFYLLNLILVLHFVSVGKAMLAERYTYLPYIGLALLPAWFISRTRPETKRVLLFIIAVFIVIFIILARKQVNVWHDSGSLWTQVIEKYPGQELARSARGKHYYRLASISANKEERKNLEEKALSDFRVAISLNTKRAEVYEYMGVIMLTRSDLKNALQLMNISIKIDPGKGRSYFNRAIVHDQMNMKEEAIRDYETALKLDPGMAPDILRNRSVLNLETGKYEQAISDLDALIKLDERNFINYYNRAFAKVMLKDIEGAIEDYKSALKLNPGDEQIIEHIRVLTESGNIN